MTDPPSFIFSDSAEAYAQRSFEIARECRQAIIDVPHVFLSFLDRPDESLTSLFQSLALDTARLRFQTQAVLGLESPVPFWKGRNYQVFITPLLKQSIDDAAGVANEMGSPNVCPVHLFWGVINATAKPENVHNTLEHSMSQIFISHRITPKAVLDVLQAAQASSKSDREVFGQEG